MSIPNNHGPLSKQMKTLTDNPAGVCIFDQDNPRSVYNLVPPAVQEAMMKISPRYYTWSEKALERNTELEARDHRLRISFWTEYQITQDEDKPTISMHSVLRGVCTKTYFYETVLFNPHKLAWVLFPPPDYEKAMDEMHHLSLKEMRKILTLPLGPKDTALMREKIKIFALLDNRIKGAVLQKLHIQQDTRNLHVHKSQREAPKSLAEIEREIKLLHNQSERALTDQKQLAVAITEAARGEVDPALSDEVEGRELSVDEFMEVNRSLEPDLVPVYESLPTGDEE